MFLIIIINKNYLKKLIYYKYNGDSGKGNNNEH